MRKTTTVDQYRASLEEVSTDTLVLPNCDLDSGQATNAVEYSLTDDTYAKLLAQLSDSKFGATSPGLRSNILQFYSLSRMREKQPRLLAIWGKYEMSFDASERRATARMFRAPKSTSLTAAISHWTLPLMKLPRW